MRFDEIIKALRLCGETTECVSERIECPYCENTDDCKRELLFDAADLIDAQQQEIEDWKDAGTVASKHNKELKQEIIRHIAEIEMDNVAIDNFVADKDEQAGRIMQQEMRIEYLIEHCEELEYLLRRTFYADALIDVLRDIFTDEEIQALAKAKAEGRLVMLPCKIGDEVWFLEKQLDIANGTCSTVISEYIVTEIRGNKYNPLWYMASSERCTHRDFHPTELGKTVFLTKEAAEKALGGGEE